MVAKVRLFEASLDAQSFVDCFPLRLGVMNLPIIDPHIQNSLTDSDCAFFKQYGFLVIRNALDEIVRFFLATFRDCTTPSASDLPSILMRMNF